MYRTYIKDVVDRFMAFCAIFFTAPLCLSVILLLVVANKGKVFFIQKRIGKSNKPFYLVKFRSMSDKKDENGNLLKDIKRLTQVGKVLRKTSLDELPQLWNVLSGEMSLVGPRPLLPDYLPYYSEKHARRHEVKPGITGLAQIAGRNILTFGQRFDLDVQYVENCSYALDMKILANTCLYIFKSQRDVQLGARSLQEIDDVGVTQSLRNHYFNK